MPPNRFESEVESFLEGSHGDRTHIKRADHHTVTPLCGTLLADVTKAANLGVRTEIRMQFPASIVLVRVRSSCCVTCVLELHAELGEGTLLG